MKNLLFSTLALTVATLTFAPVASAAEAFPASSLQQRRLEFLDTQTKAVDDVQATRLEHLNNQSKAVDDVQEARLASLDASTIAIARTLLATPRKATPLFYNAKCHSKVRMHPRCISSHTSMCTIANYSYRHQPA